jgi:hypothetical protein
MDDTSAVGPLFGVLVLVGGILVYLVPMFVAFRVEHPNTAGIVLVNLFLGWTLIGWVGALVWAVSAPSAQEQPSGLVTCPDCRRSISPLARACPGCGRPFGATP